MLRVGITPSQLQNWIRKLAALCLIEVSHLEKDLSDNVLVEARLARRRNCYVLPLQPARRVSHRSIFFGEAGARQTIDRCVDRLHFIRRNSWGLPEFACLICI